MPIFGQYPIKTFIWVSPFRPRDKHVIDCVIKFAEDRRRDCVVMILGPTSNDRVEYSYQSVLIPCFCFGDYITDFPDNFRLWFLGWFWQEFSFIFPELNRKERLLFPSLPGTNRATFTAVRSRISQPFQAALEEKKNGSLVWIHGVCFLMRFFLSRK